MQAYLKYLLIGGLASAIFLQFSILPIEWRWLDLKVRNCSVISILGIGVFLLWLGKSLTVPKSLITGLTLSLLLINIGSVMWATHQSLVIPSVIGWSSIVGIYLMTYALPIGVMRSKILRGSILLVISINVGQILLSYFQVLVASNWQLTLSQLEAVPREYGLNTNFLGSMFLLYIPLLLQLDYRSWKKWVAYSNLAVILCLLPLFNSRAVTLGLILMLGFYLWRSYREGKILYFLIGLVVYAGVTLINYQSIISDKSSYIQSYNPSRSLIEDTGDDRIDIWSNSLRLFMERPLLGHGAGNWKTEIYLYGYHRYKNGLRVGHAHSIWMETLSELGIVGLIVLLSLWMSIFWFALKTRQWHLLIALVGMSLLSSFYGIYQLNDNNLSSYLMLLFAWLGISVRRIESLSLNRVYLIPIILLLAAAAYLSYSQLLLSQYLGRLAGQDIPALQMELKDWDKYNHRFTSRFRQGKHLLFIKSNHLWNIGKRHQALLTLEEALDIYPYDKKAWQVCGERSLNLKKYKDAAVCFENAVELYNHNTKSSLHLCRLGLRFNDDRIFQIGMRGYFDITLPSFLDNYRDEYITGDDRKIRNYWLQECHAIDQYQLCLQAWQAKQHQTE